MENNRTPLVSIIMPAYNSERLIKESIDSVINQSYQKLELLIIDDGSVDKTSEIVQELIKSDPRINYSKNPGKGVSSARNHGIKHAAGEFITFLDSDDIYEKNAVKNRAEYLMNHSDVHAVFCETRLTGPKLEDLGWYMKGKPIVTFKDFHGNPVQTNAVMFRANVIRKVGFDETYTNGEDWLCFQRIARMGIDYHQVPGTYILYRQHNGTVLNNFKYHEDQVLKVLEIAYGIDPGCPDPDPRYRYGLSSPDKHTSIVNRRLRLFFFLLMKQDYESATEIGRELLSYDFSKLTSEDLFSAMRVATVRSSLCHMNDWIKVFNKHRREIQPLLYKYLPENLVSESLRVIKGKGNIIQVIKSYIKSILIKYPVLFNFINNLYIKYLRLSGKLQQNSSSSMQNLLYIPEFCNQTDFTDQYYRILWYIHPIIDNVEKIYIPLKADTNIDFPKTIPDYFDPIIINLKESFKNKIEFFYSSDIDLYLKYINKSTTLMLWDVNYKHSEILIENAITRKRQTTKTWRIDKNTVRHEGSFYLKLSSENSVFYEQDLKHSLEIFAKIYDLINKKNLEKTYIFGTGPSLKLALDSSISFDDGLTIACNSMMKNEALMRKLRPRIIVASDPIFHAGCASYAGDFRKMLIKHIQEYDAYFITSFRDFRLYYENLPTKYKNRILGIPYDNLDKPNFDLKKRFIVKAYSNVLTFFLIPIASTLTKNVYLLGNDGRKIEDNTYFWKHDPASQINDKMDDIQVAHPAFFKIDYNDYYFDHISKLDEMLLEGEKLGYKFYNLTPSYIPALKNRTFDSPLQMSHDWSSYGH